MLAFISAVRRLPTRLAALSSLALLALTLTACDNSGYGSHQFGRSIAKAAPFFAAIQRGEVPTDEEIKAARIGTFEPLLLTQVGMRREIDQVYAAYQAQWIELDVEDMLRPEQLASASARAKSLAKLRAASTWNGDFENKISAVIEHGERDVQAIIQTIPSPYASKGETFTAAVVRIRDYLLGVSAVRTEYQRHVQDLIAQLDANPKGFRLQRGENSSLLAFRDTTLGEQYNAKLDDIDALLQRSEAMDQAFKDAQEVASKRVQSELQRLAIEKQR